MQQYLALLNTVLDRGTYRPDRTGTGTLSVFGHQMRFDLSQGFPLLTTKQIHVRSVVYELLWFLSGSTNASYLKERGVRIWDEWAGPDGDLGPIYGKQWRSWGTKGIDQITNLIEGIKADPYGRRHIVTAWNPEDLPKQALPPCHCMFQFYVADGKLSCQLYQRSADIFLGVPFNIASYSLLTILVAQECGLKPGEFIHTLGDAHLYMDHIEQARLQLTRLPKKLPEIRVKPGEFFSRHLDDFEIIGYDPYPIIPAKVSV